MERRTINGQLRADDSEEMRISGYFAVFDGVYNMWDGATESIAPSAFDTLEPDDDIRCLIDHDTRLVLGRTSAGTLTLKVDEKGLYGSVLVNPKDQDAVNLYERVKRGDVSQCSFGFEILDEDCTRDGASVHWTIKSVRLFEVSAVTFPAYAETSIAARKRALEDIERREREERKHKLMEKLERS